MYYIIIIYLLIIIKNEENIFFKFKNIDVITHINIYNNSIDCNMLYYNKKTKDNLLKHDNNIKITHFEIINFNKIYNQNYNKALSYILLINPNKLQIITVENDCKLQSKIIDISFSWDLNHIINFNKIKDNIYSAKVNADIFIFKINDKNNIDILDINSTEVETIFNNNKLNLKALYYINSYLIINLYKKEKYIRVEIIYYLKNKIKNYFLNVNNISYDDKTYIFFIFILRNYIMLYVNKFEIYLYHKIENNILLPESMDNSNMIKNIIAKKYYIINNFDSIVYKDNGNYNIYLITSNYYYYLLSNSLKIKINDIDKFYTPLNLKDEEKYLLDISMQSDDIINKKLYSIKYLIFRISDYEINVKSLDFDDIKYMLIVKYKYNNISKNIYIINKKSDNSKIYLNIYDNNKKANNSFTLKCSHNIFFLFKQFILYSENNLVYIITLIDNSISIIDDLFCNYILKQLYNFDNVFYCIFNKKMYKIKFSFINFQLKYKAIEVNNFKNKYLNNKLHLRYDKNKYNLDIIVIENNKNIKFDTKVNVINDLSYYVIKTNKKDYYFYNNYFIYIENNILIIRNISNKNIQLSYNLNNIFSNLKRFKIKYNDVKLFKDKDKTYYFFEVYNDEAGGYLCFFNIDKFMFYFYKLNDKILKIVTLIKLRSKGMNTIILIIYKDLKISKIKYINPQIIIEFSKVIKYDDIVKFNINFMNIIEKSKKINTDIKLIVNSYNNYLIFKDNLKEIDLSIKNPSSIAIDIKGIKIYIPDIINDFYDRIIFYTDIYNKNKIINEFSIEKRYYEYDYLAYTLNKNQNINFDYHNFSYNKLFNKKNIYVNVKEEYIILENNYYIMVLDNKLNKIKNNIINKYLFNIEEDILNNVICKNMKVNSIYGYIFIICTSFNLKDEYKNYFILQKVSDLNDKFNTKNINFYENLQNFKIIYFKKSIIIYDNYYVITVSDIQKMENINLITCNNMGNEKYNIIIIVNKIIYRFTYNKYKLFVYKECVIINEIKLSLFKNKKISVIKILKTTNNEIIIMLLFKDIYHILLKFNINNGFKLVSYYLFSIIDDSFNTIRSVLYNNFLVIYLNKDIKSQIYVYNLSKMINLKEKYKKIKRIYFNRKNVKYSFFNKYYNSKILKVFAYDKHKSDKDNIILNVLFKEDYIVLVIKLNIILNLIKDSHSSLLYMQLKNNITDNSKNSYKYKITINTSANNITNNMYINYLFFIIIILVILYFNHLINTLNLLITKETNTINSDTNKILKMHLLLSKKCSQKKYQIFDTLRKNN